jgi:hypothetical protein
VVASDDDPEIDRLQDSGAVELDARVGAVQNPLALHGDPVGKLDLDGAARKSATIAARSNENARRQTTAGQPHRRRAAGPTV